MKFNFTLLCIITIVMGTVINTSATHLQSHLLFTARMNGSQEVPAVTTNASGVAGFSLNPTRDTLCINVSLQGLSGDVTGIHIHEGLPGTNGDVILDLTPFIAGNRLSTSLTGSALTTELIAKMLAGSYYLNAHTDLNPNGEIRGQIILETDASYIAKLDGTQEVPQVETDAKGLALFTLSKDLTSLKVKVLVRQLSGAITGAHLHVGATGTSGSVVSDLTDFAAGDYIEGEVDPTSFLADLMAGNVYVNVHTDDNPNGEIRGQLSLNKNLAFDAKLNGAQEVPAVTTDALGLFTARISYTLDTLYYYGLVRDLSGPIGGAHFHEGAVGVSGDVVADLTNDVSGNQLEGMITGAALTEDLINDLLSGNIYVNLHTDLNPNGEIRGQVYRFVREGYTFEINGAQEVPMVSTAASGFGITTIDRDQTNAHFMIVFSGLSAAATGAHFHKGVTGVNGDVIFDLTPYLTLVDNEDATFGYWKSTDTTPFTVANSVQFRNDSVYFNVHTDANPNGEIRGDSKRGTTCFNISVGLNEVVGSNESISIYPNPAAGQLNVDAGSIGNQVNAVEIYDLSGRLLQHESGQKLFNNKLTMDITKLAPGMYLLSIETSNQKIMKPFTKQ